MIYFIELLVFSTHYRFCFTGLATLSRGLFIGLENINSFKAADNWMQQVALSTDPEFAQARAKLVSTNLFWCKYYTPATIILWQNFLHH